jgi:hypothetical protein
MESSNHTPFFELTGVSLNIKINYAHYFGVPKETIVEKLGIEKKLCNDVLWLYENKGYKEKIEKFLQKQQDRKNRAKTTDGKPVPFDQLEDCSLTFKVNYAFHFQVPKEEIIEKLKITLKRYIDVTWLYKNKNYEQRILKYLSQQGI